MNEARKTFWFKYYSLTGRIKIKFIVFLYRLKFLSIKFKILLSDIKYKKIDKRYNKVNGKVGLQLMKTFNKYAKNKLKNDERYRTINKKN